MLFLFHAFKIQVDHWQTTLLKHVSPGYFRNHRQKGWWNRKKRLIFKVNGKVEFPCGLMAMKNGTAYISINKKRMKEAGATAGDTVLVELKEDKSKYGMPMPEKLNEVLLSDPEGKERFEKLTPGKQRNIIHFVSSIKSSQLKIDRALKLINNLKLLPAGKEKVREIFLGPGV